MNAPTSYAREKLMAASRMLATGTGTMRERLIAAGQEVLLVEPSSIPEPLRSQLTEIQEAMTNKPEREAGLGQLASTVGVMRHARASAIAAQIFDLDYELR